MQTADLRGSRLSIQQAHLWELQGDTQTYWVQCVVSLDGPLQGELIHLACVDVVRRHEILRTVFRRLPGLDAPLQMVNSAAELVFAEYDLQSLDASSQMHYVEETLKSLRKKQPDLTHGPVMHIFLLKKAEEQAFLLLSLPALCADVPTLKLFIAEMAAAYASQMQDEPESLEDEALQYADVSAWQNEVLEEEEAHLRQSSWAQIDLARLASFRLPFEQQSLARLTTGEFSPQHLTAYRSPTLSNSVLSASARAGVSPEAFLLSCWQLLLWRLTGEDDIPVGVACDGRLYEDLEQALGLYTRVVPLSSYFDREGVFSELLLQVQDALEQAKNAQIYFHWDYLRKTQHGAQRADFFPFSFELISWPVEFIAGKLRVSPVQCFNCTERFILKLAIQQFANSLRWEFHFDAARMQPEQVQRVADSFSVLLQAAVDQPQTEMSRLPLLSQQEQARLLQVFRGPEYHYPAQTLQQLFEEQVEKNAGAPAVICGDQSLTYELLNTQANRLAFWLKRHSVGRDVLVGLCLDRSMEMLIGLLAVLKAGGAYVPLDPDFPSDRLAFQFKDTQAPVLLTQEHLLARLPAFRGQVFCLDRDRDLWANEESANPPFAGDANNLAYVIYTSGSTGVPKGVQIRQRSLVNYTCDMRKRIAPASNLHFATVSTLAADLGNTVIFSSLASGGCLHILAYEILASGEAFADYIEQRPIDVLKIVPSHYQALLASSAGRDIFPRKYLVLGGETLFAAFLQVIRQRGAQCAIINHYGPTETTIGALVNELGVFQEIEESQVAYGELESIPVGYPIANTQVCIVDQHQQIVPVGIAGEVLISGAGLATGYLHQPELTSERFQPHPFFQDLLTYKTGDLARYTPDDKIEFIGRTDRQTKLRGYRIELGEIEATLRLYPSLREAVVVLRDEGLAEKRLVAYIVGEQPDALVVDEVRGFLAKALPEYMLPAVIMQLPMLPLTANGKLDYQALPPPEQSTRGNRIPYVAPRSPIEEVLLGIWQDVLRSSQQFGIYDNFFMLGGHSLLVTQVISRLKSTLQVNLSIVSLFEHATIASLAEQIETELHNDLRQRVPLLTPAALDEDLPLSFSQQRLWFLSQMESQSSAYNVPFALRIKGPLSPGALEQSLGEIVCRHAILRTTFTIKDEQPLQHIHPWHSYHLECQTLNMQDSSQRESELRRLMQEEAQRLFDLSQGPLLRTLLLKLDEDDYVLLLTMHHIVSDGWSNGILLHELRTFYAAYSGEEPAPLLNLPVQYADYAVWQRQWFQGEVMQRQLDYWTQQLAGLPLLDLPTDYQRPAIQSFHGAERSIYLPDELVEKLKQLSQREGTTLFMTLLAAFQALLARYSGQEDIAVGTPIANRHYAGIENLIGPFINMLVLRTDLSGNPTFRDLLQRVRKGALEAYAHQDMPFEYLVEACRPERDLSRSPLFQVMFVLQNMPVPDVRLHGVSLIPYERENTTSKFDLTLTVLESQQGFQCVAEYNTDLFEAGRIQQLLQHWQRLLVGLVEHLDQPYRSLELLGEEETQQLLRTWNATHLPLSALPLVPQQIMVQARQTPERMAVEDSREQLSYQQLARRSAQVAWLLQRAGVRAGDRVGVYLSRSVDLVVGLLAVWRLGAAYVPLDPEYPWERLEYMVEQSGVVQVLMDEPLVDGRCWPAGVGSVWFGPEELPEVGGDIFQIQARIEAEDVAYVIYTSGSTGRPKGVAIGQGALRNSFVSLQHLLGLSGEDRVLAVTSLSFDIAGLELLQPLTMGAQICVLSRQEARDGEELLRQIQAHRITLLQATPATWRLLLQAGWRGQEGVTMVCGGEPLPQELARELVGKGEALWNVYGPTETTIWSTGMRIREGGERVPIGGPIGNTQVYVLDEEGRLVPPGVVGELYIGGSSVALGYWGQGRQTAERFVPDAFGEEAGGRLYRTGDEVRWVGEGMLEYVGRKDQQVKVRGYRIELGEIEGALEQLEEIEAAIAGVQAEGTEKRLVGYVVKKAERVIDEQEIKRRLQERLPGYMVPEWIVFLPALPLTPNGKVDRRGLSALASGTSLPVATASQPQNQIEELLVGLWATTLQRADIDREANFFELGGHSLLATQLLGRVRAVFPVAMPLRALFEAPTVAAFARRLEQALGTQPLQRELPLMARPRPDVIPLSSPQQRLWFLEHLEPGSPAYHVPAAVRLRGPLQVEVLQASLRRLMERHESLRTTFHLQEGMPFQHIWPALPLCWQHQDLAEQPEAEREARMERMVHQAWQQPFDLEEGPLMRALLIRLGEQEHVFVLTLHHLVTDAWSNMVLLREITQLYAGLAGGQEADLPPLTIQYADYALWQQDWLKSSGMQEQLHYWKAQLDGSVPLQLPTDHPRPAILGNQGAEYRWRLSEDLVEQIRQTSRREGVTLFMTLQAALQVLLARISGQEDIAVGTLIANRSRAECEPLVGFFVNALVLRTDLSGQPHFRQVLERVREVSLGAYAHQDLPFEKLVEELQPERDLSRSPLFQVLLVLQNTPSVPLVENAFSVEVLPTEHETSLHDLMFMLNPDAQGILCVVRYNTDLFEVGTIARLLQWYQGVLEALVTDVEQSAFRHPRLLSPEEVQRLHAWNQTARRTPLPASFSACWQAQVSRHGSNLAVVWGEQRVSYAQLDARVQHLAGQLHVLGAGPERVVAVHLERSLDWVVSLLAILAVGAAYLPLEPELPAQRLAGMLQQACPWIVLTRPRWQEVLEPLRPAGCSVLVLPDEGMEADPEPGEPVGKWESGTWGGDQLAYVLYTSGSTGAPKGAMVHQQGLLNHLIAKIEALQLDERDRVGQNASQSFDISLWQVLAVLLAGGAVVGFSQEQRGDPRAFCAQVRREQVSVIEVVPSFVRAILEEEGVPEGWEQGVRWMVVTGEAFGKELARRWRRRYPGVRVLNAYGPTECADDVTHQEVEQGEWEEEGGGSVPIGRGLPQTRLYVLDRWGMEVPIGREGELYVGGSGVGRGYVGEAGKTAERFVPDGYGEEEGGRLYRTGDVVRYGEDGELAFVGRVDEQVKVRGYRIELGEIEAVLGQHPLVGECVVTLVERRKGEAQLVGYIVTRQLEPERAQQTLERAQIRAYLGKALPEYMVPEQFVQLSSIPLTANGKIDRQALQRRALLEERWEDTGTVEEPETPGEQILREIWQQVLGQERISRQSNFFALGGHSLLVVRVRAAIQATQQLDIPLRQFFEHPTLEQQAALLDRIRLSHEPAAAGPALVAVSREEPLPLSFGQQRMWFLHQLEPENPSYNLPLVLRIEGKLEIALLDASLQQLIARHESLRTSFPLLGGQPVQHIEAASPVMLRQRDLRNLEPEEQQRQATLLIEQEEHMPFDLAHGPLLRVLLVHLQSEAFLLLLTQHHIISDAWSHQVFVREFLAIYRGCMQKQEVRLPALAIQYADYAVWQRSWFQGERFQEQLAFWTRCLAGISLLELPTDWPRPAALSGRGSRLPVRLSSAVQRQLQTFSAQEGVTLFMTLLAGLQTVLARLSGQQDIAIGTPITNRGQVETADVIGFFLNTLVIRAPIRAQQSFRQLVQQARECCLEAYAHQDLPFEHLVEVLQPQRDLSRSPLFQVLLVVQHEEELPEPVEGLQVMALAVESHSAKFELTISLTERKDGLQGWIEYSTDLFSEQSIRWLASRWERLLEQALCQPDVSVGNLSILHAEEQRLLTKWSGSDVAVCQSDRTLTQLFEQQVERTPAALAVISGEETWSYERLEQQANRLARLLQESGVGPEVPVGLFLNRGSAFLVGVLAVLKAGGVYLPLDPAYPASRLAFMLADSGAQFVLTQRVLYDQLPAREARRLVIEDLAEQLTRLPGDRPPSLLQPDHPAYLIYTSGSTGQPKGISMPHRSLCNLIDWQCGQEETGRGKRTAQFSALSFDVACQELFATWASGGTIVLLREEERVDGHLLASRLAEQRVERVFLPVVALQQLAQAVDQGAPEPVALREVITAGEQLQITAAVRRFFQRLPAGQLINQYGPAETHVVSAYRLSDQVQAWETHPPIGRPVTQLRLYVLTEMFQQVPLGSVGELYIGGAGLARGYWQRGGQTAERFLPDALSGVAGARLYRTGDLVRYRGEGDLEYVGRADSQVKIRGYRVELEEIAMVLSEHERVREAVAVVQESAEGERWLVGYVAPETTLEATFQVEELRAYLRARLPGYMVPQHLVVLERLPLTPSGKVDRRALPDVAQTALAFLEQDEAPRTAIEELLVGLWATTLQRADIDREANFFELGGHSLLATQLLGRVRAVFPVAMPLRALFEAPTVAAFARRLEQALGTQPLQRELPLMARPRPDVIPLSSPQQRLWFLEHLEPGSPAYHVPAAVRLRGPLQVEVLQASLRRLMERHESLRTTFHLQEGMPFQHIWPALPLCWQHQDLAEQPEAEREARMERMVHQAWQQPFDLEEGPLMRALLIQLGEQEHVFVLTLHHLVTDAWSNMVLLREITQLYAGLAGGQEADLPPLTIQYADYALWQQDWLKSSGMQEQLHYWKAQLDGSVPLQLPTDHPRPAILGNQGAEYRWRLSEDLVEQIRQTSRREGVTLFMTLQAALQVLLARISGQEDIAVGTLIANRSRAECEPLVGFFVNALVLRTDLSGQPHFRQVLERVREVSLGAYAHQDLPFEKLVEELQPERDLSRSPLFQVLLVLQNTPSVPLVENAFSVEVLPTEHETSLHDLMFMLNPDAQGILCVVRYNTDLFEVGTIARLLQWYQGVLEALVTDVEQSAFRHPRLLSPEEVQRLHAWNQTARRTPLPASFSACWQAQVSRHGSNLAVVWGEQRVSYAQLDARVQHLAGQLHVLGAGPERVVAVHLERSLDWVVSLLAILAVGAAYLPLEPELPAQRLAGMLQQACPWIVLTRPRWQEVLEPLRPAGCSVLVLPDAGLGADPEPGEPVGKWESGTWGGDQLAYVLYTSGSTGAPKGAMVHQQGLLNHLIAKIEALQLDERDRVGQNASQSFDISLWQVLAVLLAGGAVVGFSQEQRGDPRAFCAQVRREQVSVIEVVPSFVRAILEEEGVPEGWEQGVRWMVVTGEAFGKELARRWRRRYPGVRVLNAYGPTECADDVTHQEVEQEEWEEEGGGSVPIGRGLPQTRLYVLDRWGMEVPIGREGELYVGGSGVGRGYVGEAGKTAERFVPDGYGEEEGGRLYRTGDVVRYGERGELAFVGRVDEQVKVRGYRIELGEIEAVLGQHPLVGECVVTTVERIKGEAQLVGYIVTRQLEPERAQQTLERAQIRAYLGKALPEYMVPEQFVQLSSIPLTANGKIDRQALQRRALLEERWEDTGTVEEPETPGEQILREIWQQVLGQERISRQSNFFALGGHSLLVVRVRAAIQATQQLDIPLRQFFEHPTLEQQAALLDRIRLSHEPAAAGPALVAVSREEPLPLSFGQQRMWFLHQLEPENPSYNLPLVLRIEGKLEIALLDASLQQLIARHESLRTSFPLLGGQPVQHIEAASPVMLRQRDLRNLEPEEQQRQATLLIEQEEHMPFDLAHGPLLRVLLVHLQSEAFLLLLTQHHIISDAWSHQVFVREFLAIYRGCMQKQEVRLPALAIQYADYAVWQRSWFQGERFQEQLAFWTRRLAGISLLELPTDWPRPAALSGRGSRLPVRLSSAVQRQLQTFSAQEGVTLFMTLLAGLQTVLARLSGQQDIAIGTPITNRGQVETADVIGFFLNTLVIRAPIRAQQSFRQLVQQARECCLEAYAHQDLPFEHLVEVLQPQRDLSRSPLFQVLLVVQHEEELPEPVEGLQVMALAVESHSAKFELTISLTERKDGLQGWIEYSTDLFSEQSIRWLASRWERLLEQALCQPDVSVGNLSILHAEEQRLLTKWSGSDVAVCQSDRTLTRLFEQQVERTPAALAVISGEETWSYERLEQQANRLARLLQESGVGPEVPVGLFLNRGSAFLVGVLAVLKAGGVYLPLDPAYPASRLAFMLADSGAQFVLTQRVLYDQLPAREARRLVIEDLAEQLTRLPGDRPPSLLQPDHPAYLIYTSGSTGQPKGISMPHRSLCNLIDWQCGQEETGRGKRTAQFSALSFDVACQELFATWASGGTIVLLREEERVDGHLLASRLAEQRVERVFLPVVALQQLAQAVDQGAPEPVALREVITAGEQLQITAAVRRFFQRLPAGQLINQYGPAETHVVSAYRLSDQVQAWETHPPIGRPVTQLRLYVLTEMFQQVPLGSVGELYIGGAGLARGYWQRGGQTAERFLPDALSGVAGARLYRTGDLVRYRGEGDLEYVGRADSQVKIRGYRVELEEIAMVLSEHERVREAVAVVQESAEGERWLVGYVAPETTLEATFQVEELRAYLRARLPGYMVPQHLVVLERLPLTPSGKVDRRALPAITEIAPSAKQSQFALPRTPVEEIIVEIWRDLLKLPSIDTQTHFFEVGGHSLLATQVVARIAATLQIELPLRTLFETPVLSDLAKSIELQNRERHRLTLPLFLPAPRSRDLPLSFAQQRLWFLDQLNPGDPAYNLPLAATIQGELNIAALEQSLNEVIRRHEVLRMVFAEKEGQAVQLVTTYQLHLGQDDLSALPVSARAEEARHLAQLEAELPFDLRHGPLVRARLLRLADNEHLLLLTFHHIVADGWSLGVLLRELTALYMAFAQGEPSTLPELALQYADFAVWQRNWLQGEALEAHLHYWTKQLRGALPLNLPTVPLQQLTPGYAGDSHDFRLSAGLSNELLMLSRREGVTLFMTLLAAFQTLLYRHTQQEDILVGTDIANRTNIETEKLIGFFVNLLALRTSFSQRPSFRELLHRVQKTVLDAYTHQDAPFEYLVDALEPGLSSQRQPLIQVLFVLQNTPAFKVELPGLTLSTFEREGPLSAKFDLAVFLHEHPEGLLGTAVFRTDLFAKSTITAWMEHFVILLQSIVSQVDTPVSELEIYPEAERLRRQQKKYTQKRGIRSAKREHLDISNRNAKNDEE